MSASNRNGFSVFGKPPYKTTYATHEEHISILSDHVYVDEPGITSRMMLRFPEFEL